MLTDQVRYLYVRDPANLDELREVATKSIGEAEADKLAAAVTAERARIEEARREAIEKAEQEKQKKLLLTPKASNNKAQGRGASRAPWDIGPTRALTLEGSNKWYRQLCNAFGVTERARDRIPGCAGDPGLCSATASR